MISVNTIKNRGGPGRRATGDGTLTRDVCVMNKMVVSKWKAPQTGRTTGHRKSTDLR